MAFDGRVGAFLLKSFCVGDWGQMLAGALYEAGLGASVQKAGPLGPVLKGRNYEAEGDPRAGSLPAALVTSRKRS